MLDIFFIILFFTFPFIIAKIMNSIGLNIFKINIPSFVIISMFVYAYSGIFILYFGLDEYRYSMGVTDKLIVFRVYVFSTISIVGLVAGFTYSKYILTLKNNINNIPVRCLSSKELSLIFLLVLFCFSVLFIYIYKLPSIALFVALTDGTNEAKIARSLMGNDFLGKYHWYYVVIYDLFKLLTFALFCAYLITRKKIVLFLFIITFLGSSFTAILATEKAPFVEILLGLFLTYAITKLKGKIPIYTTIIFFIIIFSILITFYISFMGSNDVSSAFLSIFSRALAGSIQPAYHYLEFFPAVHDFLGGRSFPNPGGLMPFEPFRMTVEVMNWVNPNDKGIVGSMPTVFWGEAYANFGFLGVLIIPFFLGVILYIIDFYINKLENTPIKIALYVWLILHLKHISTGGFSGFFVDFYLIVICFFIFTTIAIANKFRIKYYRKEIKLEQSPYITNQDEK